MLVYDLDDSDAMIASKLLASPYGTGPAGSWRCNRFMLRWYNQIMLRSRQAQPNLPHLYGEHISYGSTLGSEFMWWQALMSAPVIILSIIGALDADADCEHKVGCDHGPE